MASTLQIIDAIKGRLNAKFPMLAVEHFPDKPDEYRLNHPRGALLVSHLGSKFDETVATDVIAQPRHQKFSVTVVLRQLNGRGGAQDISDQVILTLAGFKPPDCKKMSIVSERYLGEEAGIWQYAVDVITETMLIEEDDMIAPPVLTNVDYEEV